MKTVEQLIVKTHKASAALRNATEAQLKRTLKMLADTIEKNSAALLKANGKDIARQKADDPRTDRLLLNEQRIKNIAGAIRKIASQPDT